MSILPDNRILRNWKRSISCSDRPSFFIGRPALSQESPAYTAAPTDVRKASGPPEAHGKILDYAQFWAQPRDWFDSVPAGLSHRRTSDGQAATKEGSPKPKGRLPAAR